jgi:hypothetical protein
MASLKGLTIAFAGLHTANPAWAGTKIGTRLLGFDAPLTLLIIQQLMSKNSSTGVVVNLPPKSAPT